MQPQVRECEMQLELLRSVVLCDIGLYYSIDHIYIYSCSYTTSFCCIKIESYLVKLMMDVILLCKAPVTPGLRPCYDLPATEKWANRRKYVRLVSEVVRLVTGVVGDRKGQISRSKVVVMLKTQSHRAYDQVTTYTCDRKMLESWVNRRTNVRLVAEVVRLVAEVVGDRNGQISRNKVDGHVQNWSCHLTIGGTNNRLLTDIMKCGDVSVAEFHA